MRNKTGILILALIIAALSLYNLSFTYIAGQVEDEAAEAATTDGRIDYMAKQAYLDSVWNQEVFAGFTYKEIKDKELKLGLDLQGGMHLVLEVSAPDVIKSLAANQANPALLAALDKADKKARNSQDDYVDLFVGSYKESNTTPLSRVFATSSSKDKINSQSSDADVAAYLQEQLDESINLAFEIIRTRIDKFGVAQPNIQRLPGTGRIQVELPGSTNPERVRKLLSGVAKLEFLEVWEPQELAPFIEQLNQFVIKNADMPEIASLRKKGDAANTAGNLPADAAVDLTTLAPADVDADAGLGDLAATDQTTDTADMAMDDSGQVIAAAADTLAASLTDSLAAQNSLLTELFVPIQGGLAANVRDTARVNTLLAMTAVKSLFPYNLGFAWEAKPLEGNDGNNFMILHAVKRSLDGKAAMDGSVITDARQDYNERSQPEVLMQMNAAGASSWRKITRKNIGRRVAIALDGAIYSAPNILGEIPNGSSSISGSFTLEEAQDLANILKAGKLPAPTNIVEEAIVGPSLGQESIDKGFMSTAIGLALVILLMILYYSKGGIFADVALLLNVLFIMGVLAQFGSALTLPGIAGLVLTLGMAVDANVLIFERIKEELAKGLALSEAVSVGYKKAYSSIIDGNLTTAITGAILLLFGTGGVKGFALTLLIGLACSLFTSVFITRLLIEWFGIQSGNKLNLTTSVSKLLAKTPSIDVIKSRKIAYTFSSLFILVGLGAAFLNGGFNLGVDFTGGRSYVVKFQEAVSTTDVASVIQPNFENQGTEVKTYNGNDQLKITTNYLKDDPTAEADEK